MEKLERYNRSDITPAKFRLSVERSLLHVDFYTRWEFRYNGHTLEMMRYALPYGGFITKKGNEIVGWSGLFTGHSELEPSYYIDFFDRAFEKYRAKHNEELSKWKTHLNTIKGSENSSSISCRNEKQIHCCSVKTSVVLIDCVSKTLNLCLEVNANGLDITNELINFDQYMRRAYRYSDRVAYYLYLCAFKRGKLVNCGKAYLNYKFDWKDSPFAGSTLTKFKKDVKCNVILPRVAIELVNRMNRPIKLEGLLPPSYKTYVTKNKILDTLSLLGCPEENGIIGVAKIYSDTDVVYIDVASLPNEISGLYALFGSDLAKVLCFLKKRNTPLNIKKGRVE